MASKGEPVVQKSTGFLAARGVGCKICNDQNRSTRPSFPWPLKSRTLSPSMDWAM